MRICVVKKEVYDQKYRTYTCCLDNKILVKHKLEKVPQEDNVSIFNPTYKALIGSVVSPNQ